MTEQRPLLEAERLEFAHPGAAALFRGLTLRIPERAFVRVNGASGTGKSTLLRLFARLDDPTGGALRHKGTDYADIEAPTLRARVGYLQQTPCVLDANVRGNLLLPFNFAANKGLKKPDDERLRHELNALLLKNVSLEDNAATLSVGQKQRLCLARSLLLPLEALLLDEPVSSLDPESRRVVEERTLQAHLGQGLAVLLVSHHEDPLLPEKHYEVELAAEADHGATVPGELS